MTETKPRTLLELHASRYDWAFSAHDEFIESLSEESKSTLNHGNTQEEAFVVVFGETQVGKTTLILDLLGVTAESIPKVSYVLRGARASTHSATATATEYRRSNDQRWGLSVEQKAEWFSDDASMIQALADLRSAMERRHLPATRPCVVFIPDQFFSNGPDQPLIRMLDLPGDKPANMVEQEHVRTMAGQYIPHADIILLVGRGDNLAFLQPGKLELPGIEDWQIMPTRFRVVTTYSYFAKSVRELISKHTGRINSDFLRQRLIDQIETIAPLTKEARDPSRFFPLEFGDSWRATKGSDPSFHAKLAPIIEELKLQLHADLRAATGNLARLKRAVQSQSVIQSIKDRRQSSYHLVRKRAQYEQKIVENSIQTANEAIRDLERKKNSSSKLISAFSIDNIDDDLENQLDFEYGYHLIKQNEKVSDLLSSIVEINRWLKESSANRYPFSKLNDHDDESLDAQDLERARIWRKLRIDVPKSKIDEIVTECFSDIKARLKSYWVDRYWNTDEGSNYTSDCSAMFDSLYKARTQTLDLCRAHWKSAVAEHLASLQSEVESNECSQLEWKSSLSNFDAQHSAWTDQLQKIDREHGVQMAVFDKDLKKCVEFRAILDRHYRRELEVFLEVVRHADKPDTRISHLIAGLARADARQELDLKIN